MSRRVYIFIDGSGTFADAIYLDELSLIGEDSEVGAKVEIIYLQIIEECYGANLSKGRDAKPKGLKRFIKRYDSLVANRCKHTPALLRGRRVCIYGSFATFAECF